MTWQRAAAELNWAEEDGMGGGWLVCATIGGTWAWGNEYACILASLQQFYLHTSVCVKVLRQENITCL